MTLYTVRIPCECAGAWRIPGVPFTLTADQARPISPPLGSVVYPYVAPVATPEQEPTNGRQHRDRGRNRRSAK